MGKLSFVSSVISSIAFVLLINVTSNNNNVPIVRTISTFLSILCLQNSLKTSPESEGIDALEMLRSFYKEHYYASNMSLVVIGGYDLDQLQQHVVKCFSDIRSKDPPMSYSWDQRKESPLKSYGPPLANSGLADKIHYIAPVRDKNVLSITWQVRSD